ncbi:hypothetical protein DJ519_31000, partial [Klebsiella michiganensis]
ATVAFRPREITDRIMLNNTINDECYSLRQNMGIKQFVITRSPCRSRWMHGGRSKHQPKSFIVGYITPAGAEHLRSYERQTADELCAVA